MAQDGTRQYKTWVELAEKATKESDPDKLMLMIAELCRALDEQEAIPTRTQVRPPTRSTDS